VEVPGTTLNTTSIQIGGGLTFGSHQKPSYFQPVTDAACRIFEIIDSVFNHYPLYPIKLLARYSWKATCGASYLTYLALARVYACARYAVEYTAVFVAKIFCTIFIAPPGASDETTRQQISLKALAQRLSYEKEIANIAYLTSLGNKQASNRPPAEYLPEVLSRYPDALARQVVTEQTALWSIDRFEDFLAERRQRL
jgi:hypothetical protein